MTKTIRYTLCAFARSSPTTGTFQRKEKSRDFHPITIGAGPVAHTTRKEKIRKGGKEKKRKEPSRTISRWYRKGKKRKRSKKEARKTQEEKKKKTLLNLEFPFQPKTSAAGLLNETKRQEKAKEIGQEGGNDCASPFKHRRSAVRTHEHRSKRGWKEGKEEKKKRKLARREEKIRRKEGEREKETTIANRR